MHRAMRGEASPHKLPGFVLVVPSLAQSLALQTPGGGLFRQIKLSLGQFYPQTFVTGKVQFNCTDFYFLLSLSPILFHFGLNLDSTSNRLSSTAYISKEQLRIKSSTTIQTKR